MNQNAMLTWLTRAIQEVTRASSVFQTSGELPAVDPGIVVEGLGKLKFPLKPAAVKRLKVTGQIAPYGQGTGTV